MSYYAMIFLLDTYILICKVLVATEIEWRREAHEPWVHYLSIKMLKSLELVTFSFPSFNSAFEQK